MNATRGKEESNDKTKSTNSQEIEKSTVSDLEAQRFIRTPESARGPSSTPVGKPAAAE